MLDVLPTTRRVVILDSCNSGGFIGDGLEADTVPAQLDGGSLWAGTVTPATIVAAIANYATFSTADSGGVSPYNAMVIAAAGAEEFSYESSSAPYNGHGVLTHFLLQAPASGDLNGDGVVTVLETFALSKAGIDQFWNAAWPGTTQRFPAAHLGGTDRPRAVLSGRAELPARQTAPVRRARLVDLPDLVAHERGPLELEVLGQLEHLLLQRPDQGLLLLRHQHVVAAGEHLDVHGLGAALLLALSHQDVLDALGDGRRGDPVLRCCTPPGSRGACSSPRWRCAWPPTSCRRT